MEQLQGAQGSIHTFCLRDREIFQTSKARTRSDTTNIFENSEGKNILAEPKSTARQTGHFGKIRAMPASEPANTEASPLRTSDARIAFSSHGQVCGYNSCSARKNGSSLKTKGVWNWVMLNARPAGFNTFE